MIEVRHEFEIVVSRVNEGPHDHSEERYMAQSISVSPDGRLMINWKDGARSLDGGGWDRLEVRRITTVHPGMAA